MQDPEASRVESTRDRPLRALVSALDGLIVLLSMGASWSLHMGLRSLHDLQAWLGLRPPPSFEEYALLSYLTLPLFLFLLRCFGMHSWFERPFSRVQLFLGVLKVHVVVLAALAVLMFLTQTVINRSMLAFFLLCTFSLQGAMREVLGRWQRFQYAQGQGRARLILVGELAPSMEAFVESSQNQAFPPEFVGRLNEVEAERLDVAALVPYFSTRVPYRGQLPELGRLLHDEPVDRVLFFPPLNHGAEVSDALKLCETHGVPAGLAVDMSPQSVARPRVDFVFGHPFVEFELAPRAAAPLAIKHGIDVLAAALGLLATAPLLLLTALAILITMGRPILFVQERAGLRGRRFRMLKFRTMVTDAEAKQASLQAQNIMGGPVFKVREDPRVTRLGRFLRASSIDELPQLFNVLTGQMSLVGPRPLPRREQEQIRGWHRRRLSMKPGITGLWQVSGRNSIGFEDWMKLDLRYVDTWSLAQDLRILLQTVPALLRRRGAY